MTKSARLRDLEHMNMDCFECDLRNGCKGIVFGEGNAESPVWVVGDTPLAGRALELLTHMLDEAGFQRSDVYITTLVKCRSKGTKPNAEQIQRCLPWLRKQFSILKPSMILLLGLAAANPILDLDKDMTMKKCRGKWFLRKKTLMMPLYHPVSVVRNPIWREILIDDLSRVKKACEDSLDFKDAKDNQELLIS